jgi:hypothetical protein
METVELFIEEISNTSLQAIVVRLVDLILTNLPQTNASIKYKIPFFAYKKTICYINPQKDQVVLGFVKGALFSNVQQQLVATDRKQIRQLVFRTEADIDPILISELLQEAILVNELY